MDKNLYLQFKKVYMQLKVVLEKSKSWDGFDQQKYDNNKIKLEESWLRITAQYAD